MYKNTQSKRRKHFTCIFPIKHFINVSNLCHSNVYELYTTQVIYNNILGNENEGENHIEAFGRGKKEELSCNMVVPIEI